MNTPFDVEPPHHKHTLLGSLRASFLTGLVVIAPVGLTIWLIWSVVGWIDGFVLPLVPEAYHPDRMIQDFFGLDPSLQINVRDREGKTRATLRRDSSGKVRRE